MSTQPTPAAARHCKVAIIGTGFSGLGMAIRLRQEGEDDFLIFEKDAGVGGTWRVNNYPGCACDVQSHVYSFSFEANPEWTRMFARQPEIRAYLEKCWEKYRLQEKTLLNTEIGKLAWDERQSLWHLHDAQGNHYTANAVVSGMGGLSTPAYPRLDGLENFQGKVFHSQQWDHDYDLKGKRVAVIGTGASAIQFVPEIQPLVAALDLYQRTPPWILPKPDRAISETERRRFRRFPLVQKPWRGGLYTPHEGRHEDGSVFVTRWREYMNWPTSGGHRLDGILFARGPGIARGCRIEGAGIQDLANDHRRDQLRARINVRERDHAREPAAIFG